MRRARINAEVSSHSLVVTMVRKSSRSSMIRSAVAGGSAAVNYARADAFTRDETGLHAVTVRDMRSRRKTTLRCKTVVNAAGPWADFVMQAASPAPARSDMLMSYSTIINKVISV